jgi:hypothetical protein
MPNHLTLQARASSGTMMPSQELQLDELNHLQLDGNVDV